MREAYNGQLSGTENGVSTAATLEGETLERRSGNVLTAVRAIAAMLVSASYVSSLWD